MTRGDSMPSDLDDVHVHVDARPGVGSGLPRHLPWLGAVAALVLVSLSASPARADIAAAYLEGYGGLSSPQSNDAPGPSTPGAMGGVGVQLGARLLIFEAYGDHTVFGTGTSVSRAILGLRGAVGLGGFRLILRAGGGVLDERGGVLVGRGNGISERAGLVARAGIALERTLAPTLLGGVGIEGEVFEITARDSAPVAQLENRISGGDIFFALHLKFELGI